MAGYRIDLIRSSTFNARVNYEWRLSDGLGGNLLVAIAYKDDVSYDIVRQPAETLEDGYP